jgi:hypothetical protein
MLQRDPVGEAILLGEILMGMDLEGDEPGDDSKCILVVYGVGLVLYVYVYTTREGTTGVLGRKGFARDSVVGFW